MIRSLHFLASVVLVAFFAQVGSAEGGYGLRKVVDIGTDNLRERPEAIARGGEERYRAAGLISCKWLDAAEKRNVETRHSATLIENGFTVVTDMHSFAHDDGTPKAKRSDCTFSTYDSFGKPIESAVIKEIFISGNGTQRSDLTGYNAPNDWAIVILNSEIKNANPFQVAPQGHLLSVNDRIHLCAFSSDLNTAANPIGDYQKRCLTGTYRDNGVRHRGLGNALTMLHDIPTFEMSSGGGVFLDDDRARPPMLYAIHGGGGEWDEGTKSYQCKSLDRQYQPERCSNYANFFSDRFYERLRDALAETGGSRYAHFDSKKASYLPLPKVLPQSNVPKSTFLVAANPHP